MARKNNVDLGTFDDNVIEGTSIKITNAGDGLSKALRTAPQLLHKDDRVFIVMDAIVGPISFEPVKGSDGVIRKHSAQAQTVTLVDEHLVRAMLDAQVELNEKLREDETGQSRLPLNESEIDDEPRDFLDPASDAPVTQHVAGLHKRKWKNCPLCFPTGHGDGEGDADNPLPPARTRRTRAKKAPAKKRAAKSAK